jgi:hypothetical protein
VASSLPIRTRGISRSLSQRSLSAGVMIDVPLAFASGDTGPEEARQLRS